MALIDIAFLLLVMLASSARAFLTHEVKHPMKSINPCQIQMSRRAVHLNARDGKKTTKSYGDEILDALDTMLGVSPLAETDLKSGKNSFDLEQVRLKRESQAPPPDSLQKPSVAVFFFLLALFPTLVSIYALQNGLRPFGL